MRHLICGIGGSMGSRRIRNLQALGYTDIIGYDTNAESLKKAMFKYDIKAIFDNPELPNNLETMIDILEPDTMIISVPPLCKQPYIDMANRHGLIPFIEADVTEYAGNYWPSATLRHHPAIQKMKELLDSGTLGKVYTFNYHMGQSLYQWHPGADMKTYYAAQKESGACREMFVFETSWLSYLFGRPTNCVGMVDKKLNDSEIKADDIYSAAVQFPACVGSILVDIVSVLAIRKLHIVGEKGTLLWNWESEHIIITRPDNYFYKGSKGGADCFKYDKGKAFEGYHSAICEQMYENELANWLDSLQGKVEYLFSREDERACIEMLKKVEESCINK